VTASDVTACEGEGEGRRPRAMTTSGERAPGVYPPRAVRSEPEELVAEIETLQQDALAEIGRASDLDALEEVRVRFTGRRSTLVALQKQLRDLEDAERRTLGAQLNAFREAFQGAFDGRRDELASSALRDRLEAERLDLTLPSRRVPPGRPHVLTQVEQEILDVFIGMGYQVAEGPEAESGTFNFDLLNIEPEHPARQEMDTIYVAGYDDVVLRTHTSPVQVRVMTTRRPPIAVVCPGRTYRADAVDATHSPVFSQVEGLVVAEGVTMADLRGTLLAFSRRLFGDDREIRLRPSFFPFTEPSAEVDVSFEGPSGNHGWLEILGAGMVDPNVLRACGIDPDRYAGFAFGIGIERVAMLRHQIRDIRELFDADARFLARF
jgi:phenylalanyl-tRNA synthetase alpha chain